MSADLSPKEALERAVDVAGGQAALAAKLTSAARPVTQQNVWSWLNRSGKAPAEWAVDIETAVSGEVTRRQLRPDVFREGSAAA